MDSQTPKNSASATLTNNSDRYFIAFKPEGSKSTHFKLAYTPGNVQNAVEEYKSWCTKLVEHDWPFCFGVPKNIEPHYHTPVSHADESDTIEAMDKDLVQLKLEDANTDTVSRKLSVQVYIERMDTTDAMDAVDAADTVDMMGTSAIETETTTIKSETITLIKEITTETTTETPADTPTTTNTPTDTLTDTLTDTPTETPADTPTSTNTPTDTLTDTPTDTSALTPIDTPTTSSKPKKQPIPPEPFITLEQLDLSNIPQSWHDIVEVAPSLIPFGGNGLFAKRKLPYNTPIGFYFGVPMTEDEFDSLKDRVGRSSEYSIMYRRTVLDATDDSGQPITDESSPRFCPFHYMNETSSQKTASVAFVEGAIVNQIICWTKKDIEKGEELLVWYGKDVHRYWTEEEEEANRKKEQKESKVEKTRMAQERKLDRIIQRQERDRVLQEKKMRKELAKLEKLEQERIKKLKRQEKKKKTCVEEEMIVPQQGQLIIVDESCTFFTEHELDQQRTCTTQPMKDIILVNYSEEE